MKISKETIKILKTFSQINGGLVFETGNFIMTRSMVGQIYAHANLEDEIDADFCISDLQHFIGILTAMGDCDIEFRPETADLKITNGFSTVYHQTHDKSMIVTPERKISIKSPRFVFDLTNDIMAQMRNIWRVQSITHINICRRGDEIHIEGYSRKSDMNSTKVLHNIVVGKYDGENDFEVILNIDNIKVDNSDYQVLVALKNQQGAVMLSSPTVSTVITMEKDSSHNFVD